MQPDKVIGLRSWPALPHSEVLFPVAGKTSLLLPFLVVEAKKEDGPGFRATQNQTAFPIRRFLRAQKDLIGHNPSSEPCLVWFFAYRSDFWRLSGCTLDDKKVVSADCSSNTRVMLIQDSRRSMIYGTGLFNLLTVPYSYCCWSTTYGPGPGTSTDL
jgi:hypothetical protein